MVSHSFMSVNDIRTHDQKRIQDGIAMFTVQSVKERKQSRLGMHLHTHRVAVYPSSFSSILLHPLSLYQPVLHASQESRMHVLPASTSSILMRPEASMHLLYLHVHGIIEEWMGVK